MAMAGALSYPDRFQAAAAYAGFDRPASTTQGLSSKFPNDVAMILYALYQQATVGPCNTPKPRAGSPVEQSKWTSWNGLGQMASTEAMRLFVKILEEEVPGWYSKITDNDAGPDMGVDVQTNSRTQHVAENGNGIPETKAISSEYGNQLDTQDKDVVSEGLGSVSAYDQWFAPPISGQRPRSRYEHGAAVVQDKMYVFGGNHNGRYLSDLQVLDLRSWAWSKAEANSNVDSSDPSSPAPLLPRAGHSLIHWGNKLLSVAGHTKNLSESIEVKIFDLQTLRWSNLKTYEKAPVSRGGQSVTLVGTTLVIFGGEDAKGALLNDLHILDLETMTWDDMETIGVPPSPRSGHSAAVHAERYLLIFGGRSHATCFNDLHVLDLQSMEWTKPDQQGETPTPRAGHAGVTIGENWFIVGGGNNTSGISETVVLNMSTLFWSVVTSVEEHVPVSSEGLSLIVSSYNGEDILVAFGGYNGRYISEVHLLKPSIKSTRQSKVVESSLPENSGVHNGVKDVVSALGAGGEQTIREISVDNDASTKKSESGESLLLALKKENEELKTFLRSDKSRNTQLRREVVAVEARSTDLYQELQSVRNQLASEQSRCFKLEVEVAELRSKLQTMESLQRELELLQKQQAASEQATMNSKQRQSSGVWGWIAGTPPNQKTDY